MDAEQREASPTPDYVVATYDEIRGRFGLGSTDAARIKAKRRKWPSEQNHPGAMARIRVPREEWDAGPGDRRSPGNESERSRSIKALEDAIAALGEDRARLQTEHNRLIGERDQARSEAARMREEREEARIRAAQAESEAKGLREALAEARKPFWRRWMG